MVRRQISFPKLSTVELSQLTIELEIAGSNACDFSPFHCVSLVSCVQPSFCSQHGVAFDGLFLWTAISSKRGRLPLAGFSAQIGRAHV